MASGLSNLLNGYRCIDDPPLTPESWMTEVSDLKFNETLLNGIVLYPVSGRTSTHQLL